MVKPQTLKGFRDFLPEQAKKRQYVINTLKSVFASFGFEPLETPALEYEEILLGKYGEEGDKLMYRFEDNGKRRVALRYDQTVPLARVVAQYGNELAMPFKRYQIQNVYRAENTQKGRYRELIQCDIDIVGSASPLSDAEILTIIAKSYKALGFEKIKILVNDRANFQNIPTAAIITIDKLKKIGADGVRKELEEKGLDPNLLETIQNKQQTSMLTDIITAAKQMGVSEDEIVYEATLARGLDYYTGIIIEIEAEAYPYGSLGGGGRYDKLIGMFSGRDIPAVGFAFGFDRTVEAIQALDLFPKETADTKVLVTIFSLELQEASIQITSRLRSKNINVELYLDETAKMEKQLKYAVQKQIPYVIVIGPEEKEKNVVSLKNMQTREQETLDIDGVIKLLS